MDIKVYLVEFIRITRTGETKTHATMHEAVSDALIMAASPELCLYVIHKRGYTLVDKEAFHRTGEYRRTKEADRLLRDTFRPVYH